MTLSGYFFRAFFTLLLTVSFSENATASGFDLTPEELAFIEQGQREQEQREQRELQAAMAASRSEHAAKKQYDESRQIEMAVEADLYAQQLKKEAEDYERALKLSRESQPVPYSPPSSAYSPSRSEFARAYPHHQAPSAAEEPYAKQSADLDGESDDEVALNEALALSMQPNTSVAAPELSAAVAAPALSERERMAQERARRYQSAPSVALSIDEQVESTFEREKREIENKINRLESIKLVQRYGSPAWKGTNTELTQLRADLQNYTEPGKITATKLRLQRYISSQQGQY